MTTTNIILVNYNSSQHTVNCLESLKSQISSKFRVWLIDNSNNSHETGVILKHLSENLKPLGDKVLNKKHQVYEVTGNNEGTELFFHEANGNLGYAAAINVALREILSLYPEDYVWVLNNDIILIDDALTPLIDKLEDNNGYVAVGSSLYTDKLMKTAECFGGGIVSKVTGLSSHCTFIPESCENRELYVEDRINYLIGASLLFKARLVEAAGLWPEKYFLYYEDVEWSQHLRQFGKLGFAEKSRLVHFRGASDTAKKSRTLSKSLSADYLQMRNRVLYLSVANPWISPIALLSLGYSFLRRLKLGLLSHSFISIKAFFAALYYILPSKSESREVTPSLVPFKENKIGERPLVSIVTATYNSSTTIRKTIESILAQNYNSFEHIIVDNQSQDNTLDIIRTLYRQSDKLSKLKIYSQSDFGISDAFNLGIRASTGENILILSSDDYFYNESSLQFLVNGLSGNRKLVHGDILFLDNRFGTNQRAPAMKSIQYSMPYNHQTMLVSRQIYEEYGLFKHSYQYTMDYEHTSRYYDEIGKSDSNYIPKPITVVCTGGASSRHELKGAFESRSFLKENNLFNWQAQNYFFARVFRLFSRSFFNLLSLKFIVRLWRDKKWGSLEKDFTSGNLKVL